MVTLLNMILKNNVILFSQNIKFILEDAGSSWNKIVDVQVFLTNMKDDF